MHSPQASQEFASGLRGNRVDRAVAHIEATFEQKIALQELAELSLHRFGTVFRREVGLPPRRHLSRVRVRHAGRFLRQGVPAAVEAGFYDQSQLARHFKSFCGVTPGEYQQRHRPQAFAAAAADPGRHPASQREDPAMSTRPI